MAFDGITLKAILSELYFLKGAKIDKIYQVNSNTITLGLYHNKLKYLLVLCIDPSNYRLHLSTHPSKNPDIAPSFCMLLRKHLLGSYLFDIQMSGLERIVTLDFVTHNSGNKLHKKIVLELMGKHSNLFLLNENNQIYECLRHVNSSRNLQTGNLYIEPPSNKADFLNLTCFTDFYNFFKNITDNSSIVSYITQTFAGFSPSFIKSILPNNLENISKDLLLEQIYTNINKILLSIEKGYVDFKIQKDKNTNRLKDYVLTICDKPKKDLALNFKLDDYYYEKENLDLFIHYRNQISQILLQNLKKYQKRLANIDKKLQECKDKDKYKLYGELITANLYKINNSHSSSINLQNYYNNEMVTIPLDNRYSPNYNAKMYYKKYRKLKNAEDIVIKQKEETFLQINYIETVLYSLENAKTVDDIDIIASEISETDLIKRKKQMQKANKKKANKKTAVNPITYIIDGYTILVGRNNKENDELTVHLANSSDLWFHTKDIHGSHVILKNPNKDKIKDDTLLKVCQITAYYSKARQSSNVPVDYCPVSYIKKPKGSKPGMVIYRNNKTIYANPKLPVI